MSQLFVMGSYMYVSDLKLYSPKFINIPILEFVKRK